MQEAGENTKKSGKSGFFRGFAAEFFSPKNKKIKTTILGLFLAVGIFVSFQNAIAAGTCENGNTEKTCECFNGQTSLQKFPAGQDISDFNAQLDTGFCSQESCMQYCAFKFPKTSSTPTTAVKFDGGTLGTSSIQNSSSAVTPAPKASEFLSNMVVIAIQFVLTQVQSLVGWLFGIAGTLFAWAIDPNNMSGSNGMLNKQAVKDVWIMVRDLLNMTFILVLLFAAFCTIFQIDSWNIKKVWFNIMLNALLVNFSFPIARFFIDVSNVAFYYFVNNLFTATGTTVSGSNIFAMFDASTTISTLLKPDNYSADAIAYQIAMIVVTFILGMTMLIVAALFIVRLVALTMIVMFSPIGFVGYIFPETKKYARDWWSSLFSYSFFAPIMIFMMSIAIRIAATLKAENLASMKTNASANAPAQMVSWIADMGFYLIPVIILWAGIGIAKKSSIAGADTVVNSAKKWGKKIADGAYWTAFKNPIARGVKEGVKEKSQYNRLAKWWKSDSRFEAATKGMIVNAGTEKGWRKGMSEAWNKVSDKDVNEKMKEYKEKGKTIDDVAKDLKSKNKVDQLAATRHLMNEKGALNDPERMLAALNAAGNNRALVEKIVDNAGDFAGNDDFTHVQLQSVIDAATITATTPEAKKKMEGKIKSMVRKENIKKLIALEKEAAKGTGKKIHEIYEENLDKLDAEGLAKQKGLHDGLDKTDPTKHDADFEDYVKHKVTADDEFHQKVFEKMTRANREKWTKAGYHPVV